MENIAQAFDQPHDSPEHQNLRATAWMGGELVSVRYWLGRLLRHNFFRESDDVVKKAMQAHFAATGCEKGSRLAYDYQSWRALAILIQDQVECSEKSPRTRNARLVAALHAMLANPATTDAQLAAIANTTEKQIARMSDVFVLRKLWRLKTA